MSSEATTGAMTAADAPMPSTDSVADRAPWGALVLLLVGTFVTVLDYFIANVAVPSIQSHLHASSAQIQLVIVGYGVAFTASLVAGGRLGDVFGRRRVYALGLAVFTAASLACGLAPSAGALVVFRIVQGAGAAALVPQVLGIIGIIYTGAQRATAFTAYGLVIGLAGVFGQLIGGVLINLDIGGADWRAVFLINVPIGLGALSLIRRVLPPTERVPNARLDVLGGILVTATLGLLVYCLVEGREAHWPPWSWAGLIGTALLAGLAVRHLRRRAVTNGQPLIDPALFATRGFTVGVLETIIYFLAMGSFFFLLALYLQQGRGLSALQSGVLFTALGVGYFGTSLLAAPLTRLLGRLLVSAGPTTLAVGYAVVVLTVWRIGVEGNIGWLLPGLVIAGTGMGMTTGPLTNMVLTGVNPQYAAAAAGVLNTAQEGGAAIGVAIVGTVFYPALGASPVAGSYAHAFRLGLLPLIGFGVLAALIAQLLPHPPDPK